MDLSSLSSRLVPGKWRQRRTRPKNQLLILMYHAIVRCPLEVYDWCFLDATSFGDQMRYLKNYCEVIPLSEAVERLQTDGIQQPTAVVTFDDGFQNNYDVAFPILRAEGLPATIFLTTGLVGTSDTVWFCRLNCAVAETRKTALEWNSQRFDLSGGRAKARAVLALKAKLKEFPHHRLLTELRDILLALGEDPDRPVEINSPFRMLSHEAITHMVASGIVEFGAHTHSHAIVSLLSPSERYDEIICSLTAVRELTGRPCEFFAYPNGRIQDYDPQVIQMLKSCGVRAAVTAIEGTNDGRIPVMEFRRSGIGANLSLAEFKRIIQD